MVLQGIFLAWMPDFARNWRFLDQLHKLLRKLADNSNGTAAIHLELTIL